MAEAGVEETADAVIILDERFCIVDANTPAEALFGYPRVALSGQSLGLLLPDYRRLGSEPGVAGAGLFAGSGQNPAQVHRTTGVHRDGHRLLAEVSFGERLRQGERCRHVTVCAARTRRRLEAAQQRRASAAPRHPAAPLTAQVRPAEDDGYDALTGLANRTFFLAQLQRALEHRARGVALAVMYLGCDRFKQVNDGLGYEAGDALLAELGARLSGCVRPGDLVARLGGDEFAVLLAEPATSDEAILAARRIRNRLDQAVVIGAQTVHMSLSIGIALGREQEAEAVLQGAAAALRQAKTLGRARYQLFDETLRERAVRLLMLETDLYRALTQQELEVYYQPIRSLAQGRLVGFEALLRWQHHELSEIAPAEFIPVAEANGLIIELDRWVLQRACTQLARWEPSLEAPLGLNVNFSSRQFSRDDLVPFVAQVLQTTGVAAGQLRLEMTESVLIGDDARVGENVAQLRALGVGIYVDDFGTGYSSLGLLQRFSIDSLKIDVSFVRDVTTSARSAELIKTVVTLARALGVTVVAEGIETEAQLEHLKTLGCEFGQGYLFAKPLSEAEATTLLAALG